MSIYNKFTKNANLKATLVERNDRRDESVWKITTTSDINIEGADGKIVPAGAIFEFRDAYDAEEDDVLSYIESRGLLDACNISDADFECDYLKTPEVEMVEIDAIELEELRTKATKYDEMVAARRRGAEKANSVSAEERKARAKKAVEARIAKYGQKRQK